MKSKSDFFEAARELARDEKRKRGEKNLSDWPEYLEDRAQQILQLRDTLKDKEIRELSIALNIEYKDIGQLSREEHVDLIIQKLRDEYSDYSAAYYLRKLGRSQTKGKKRLGEWPEHLRYNARNISKGRDILSEESVYELAIAIDIYHKTPVDMSINDMIKLIESELEEKYIYYSVANKLRIADRRFKGKKNLDQWPKYLRNRAQNIIQIREDLTGSGVVELAIAMDINLIDKKSVDELIDIIIRKLNRDYECGISCASKWMPSTAKFTFDDKKLSSDGSFIEPEDIRTKIKRKETCTREYYKEITGKNADKLGELSGELICDNIDSEIATAMFTAHNALEKCEKKYEEVYNELDSVIKSVVDYRDFLIGQRERLDEQNTRKEKCLTEKIGGECTVGDEYYINSKWKTLNDIREITDILKTRCLNLLEQTRTDLANAGVIKKKGFFQRIFG
uniref:Uncharacterized protein n=1 Tax=Pithovirus LCDPAC01 TaxID=2506600 RepID=A0A481YNM0_9VIRU|nr:MAG: hypothetical protein LCDPAC01_01680 [Pithovirus LCDPAC01]